MRLDGRAVKKRSFKACWRASEATRGRKEKHEKKQPRKVGGVRRRHETREPRAHLRVAVVERHRAHRVQQAWWVDMLWAGGGSVRVGGIVVGESQSPLNITPGSRPRPQMP